MPVKSLKYLKTFTADKRLCLSKKSYTLFLGFSKITELLVQKGADVNLVGRDGKTALIWSAEQGEKSARFCREKFIQIYRNITILFICRIL